MENEILNRCFLFLRTSLFSFGLISFLFCLPVLLAGEGINITRFQLIIALVISVMFGAIREMIENHVNKREPILNSNVDMDE